MAAAYVIFGHGSEDSSAARKRVPPGCLLVVTEECGTSGTLPAYIYAVLADAANAPLFADPVTHKAALERLLQRKIKIYPVGKEYPTLSYNLLNDENDGEETYIAPSGVHAIPTPEFAFDPTKKKGSIYRHYLPEDRFAEAFASAVEGNPSSMKVKQSQLFAKRPGIYYDFLCRELKPEKAALKELLKEDNRLLNAGHNIWGAAALLDPDTVNPAARDLIGRVMARRRASDAAYTFSTEEQLLQILDIDKPSPALKKRTMELIEAVASVNIREKHMGRTPLMLAASHKNLAAVMALVGRGADVNAADAENSTPIAFACDSGDLSVCIFLLEHGADPRPTSTEDISPLHLAAEKNALADIVPVLITMGADPNLHDEDGNTPLHNAAAYGNMSCIEALLRSRANPNSLTGEGETPLMYAIQEGQGLAAALLIPRTDLSIRSSIKTDGIADRSSALDMAIDEVNDEIAVALIEAGAPVEDWGRIAALAEERDLALTVSLLAKRDAAPTIRRRTIKGGRRRRRGNAVTIGTPHLLRRRSRSHKKRRV